MHNHPGPAIKANKQSDAYAHAAGVVMVVAVVVLFSSLFSLPAPAASLIDIVYPRPESQGDARTQYPSQLLRLALSKSCPLCRIRPSAALMPQGRALTELQIGSGEVNIVWSMTSVEREQQLQPIRIPIYKGLIGWRIPLVMPAAEAKLAMVRNVDDLRRFTFGQGEDWPDTEILQRNGLTVFVANQYDALFRMLAAGRFDLFPRAVIEIGPEALKHAASGMVIDSHIVLHYPAAFYFFVNRNNTLLADLVQRGLMQALDDGSFDRLLMKTFGSALRDMHFERRRVINLDNPLLPVQTPAVQSRLWLHPLTLSLH